MDTLKEFLKMLRDEKKNVICFGTGQMAQEALEHVEIRNAVSCFLDNDVRKQGRQMLICGRNYDVSAPRDGIRHAGPCTVILLVSGHYKAMERQLQELGISKTVKIYAYPVLKVQVRSESEEFFEQRILDECIKEYEAVLDQYHVEGIEKSRKLEEKRRYILGEGKSRRPLVLPRIMIMPTTRCNLRCQGCSSLLPLFKNPADLPAGQVIRDFEIFFSGIDACIRVTVGGEPFLYPHLNEILRYLLDQKKVSGVLLITNSTILPGRETIELLKNPKILVEISDYGHLEKMGRLVQTLERQNVNFVVLTQQTWTDMGGVENRHRSEEELRFQYLNCDQGRVMKTIHNGKFHTCARSARMLAMGAYDSEYDCFALKETERGSDRLRRRIMEMYYSEKADACNHCDLGALPAKMIEAGIQMEGNIQKSAYTIVNRKELDLLKKQAQIRD